jgi:hypothetical protein
LTSVSRRRLTSFVKRRLLSSFCWHELVIPWSRQRHIILVVWSSFSRRLRFHLIPLSRPWLRTTISMVVSLLVAVPSSQPGASATSECESRLGLWFSPPFAEETDILIPKFKHTKVHLLLVLQTLHCQCCGNDASSWPHVHVDIIDGKAPSVAHTR